MTDWQLFWISVVMYLCECNISETTRYLKSHILDCVIEPGHAYATPLFLI